MIKRTTLKTSLGSYIVVENDNIENPEFRYGRIDTDYLFELALIYGDNDELYKKKLLEYYNNKKS